MLDLDEIGTPRFPLRKIRVNRDRGELGGATEETGEKGALLLYGSESSIDSKYYFLPIDEHMVYYFRTILGGSQTEVDIHG